MIKNLLTIPGRKAPGMELFETLVTGAGDSADDFLVERIISNGEVTPEDQWYDQERDEWVAVLEGEACLLFEDGREVRLGCCDHVFLPKHCKHRVIYTSSPCIWLAVHGSPLKAHEGCV